MAWKTCPKKIPSKKWMAPMNATPPRPESAPMTVAIRRWKTWSPIRYRSRRR
jgi:hypothetical protein